jgi:hypothetical protein
MLARSLANSSLAVACVLRCPAPWSCPPHTLGLPCPPSPQTLDAFLAAKARLDNLNLPPLAEIMGVAHAGTTLRALLLRALSSGLRNDAPDAALAMRQRFRLAELRCEEYLFVLMSRFMNALEQQVGSWGGAGVRWLRCSGPAQWGWA